MSGASPLRVACVMLVVGAAFFVGCGGGDDDDDALSVDAGGVVSAGSATLDIPAGALTEDTSITIETITEVDAEVSDLGPVGDIYRFEPSGLEFETPATLTLSLDTADLSDVVDVTAGELVPFVVLIRDDDGEWSSANSTNTIYDLEAGTATITAEVSHFSTYMAWPLIGLVRIDFQPPFYAGNPGDQWPATFDFWNRTQGSMFIIGLNETSVMTVIETGVVSHLGPLSLGGEEMREPARRRRAGGDRAGGAGRHHGHAGH